MHRPKLLLALAIALAIAAFFAFDLARFFRLDYFLARLSVQPGQHLSARLRSSPSQLA